MQQGDKTARVAFLVGLLLITGAAGVARSVGLAPTTLWHDDVWVGALVELPLGAMLAAPAEVPIAFRVGSWAMLRLVPDPELALQLIPFLASLLGIVVCGFLGREATGSAALGLVAATAAVFAPHLVHYSVFVKQYTLEFLATGLVLLAGLRATRDERRDPPVVLFAAALFACLAGFGTIIVAVTTIAVVAAAHARRGPSQEAIARGALAGVVLLGVFLYWAFDLRLRAAAPLYNYWRGHFVPTESVAAAWSFFRETGIVTYRDVFPVPLGWLAWGLPAGVAVMLARARQRAVGLACLSTCVALTVAGSLRMYPLGGGRTDVFLYPVTILGVVVALGAILAGVLERRGFEITVAAACVALVFLGASGVEYFDTDQRELVDRLEERLQPEEGLVVYAPAAALTAFYSSLDVDIYTGEGRTAYRFHRPRTMVTAYEDLEESRRRLREYLDEDPPRRIWFIGARTTEAFPIAPLHEMVEAAGYTRAREWTAQIRGSLVLFRKSPVAAPDEGEGRAP